MAITDEEMVRLLTQDMDTVFINASYRGLSLQIPACRKKTSENYRISHRTLLYFYQKVRRECRDVKIVMEPVWRKCEVGYCIAACTVETKDGKSDLYFGENRVTSFSSSVDTTSPFQIAVNRAMDKAIFYEIFNLPSRFYDGNGNPVLDTDIDVVRTDNGQANVDAAQAAAPQGPAQQPQATPSVQQDNAPTGQAQGNQQTDRMDALQKEFEELGKFTLSLRRSDGSSGDSPLSSLSDKVLSFLSQSLSKSTKDVEMERKAKIDRYLELRGKLNPAFS